MNVCVYVSLSDFSFSFSPLEPDTHILGSIHDFDMKIG